jgi:hypothetical protein
MGSGMRVSGRKKKGLSRKLDVPSYGYTLTHNQTGISVKGEVVPGHYSRRQLSQLKSELLNRPWGELERKVAARLRLPGRARVAEFVEAEHGNGNTKTRRV